MQIHNESSHKTRAIRPLVDFASKFSKCAPMAQLLVQDLSQDDRLTGGESFKVNLDYPTQYDEVAPSLVKLYVAPNTPDRFPTSTQHRITVDGVRQAVGPRITLRSWEEEFVLVLSHELAHVDDFWSGNVYSIVELETRAEAAAVRVLQEYRRRHLAIRANVPCVSPRALSRA